MHVCEWHHDPVLFLRCCVHACVGRGCSCQYRGVLLVSYNRASWVTHRTTSCRSIASVHCLHQHVQW
jgi:hypothetical protein